MYAESYYDNTIVKGNLANRTVMAFSVIDLTKIDNLTDVVQQIQLNQIKDDNDIKNRVVALESSQANTRWFIGIGLSVLGLAIAWLSFKGGV